MPVYVDNQREQNWIHRTNCSLAISSKTNRQFAAAINVGASDARLLCNVPVRTDSDHSVMMVQVDGNDLSLAASSSPSDFEASSLLRVDHPHSLQQG